LHKMPCFLGKFFPLFLPQLSYFRSQLIPNAIRLYQIFVGSQFRMNLASCHASSAYNFRASVFLEIL